jgi:type I restriction enzyme S subunit
LIQTKKITTITTIRQIIMQTKTEKQLTPKLRFKEFEGEWENNRLYDLSKLITKGTTPKIFTSSGVNYVKIECLVGISINKEKCLFINEKTHSKELKRSILQENDLLFAIAGATVGKVGIVTSDILPANTNQALAIIRLKNTEYLSYTLQILQSRVMKKYIYQSISVGAQPNLNLEQIGNFEFFLPSLPEQQKIASFLAP